MLRLIFAATVIILFHQNLGGMAQEKNEPSDTPAAFSTEAIMKHVQTLAGKELLGRKAGTPFENRAVEYISKQLDQMHVSALPTGERTQIFRFGKETSTNVLGAIAPVKDVSWDELVVLGAHLDHVGVGADGAVYPGADDNASGVAVVLEVARQLQRNATALRRPVIVVLFGAEEVGLIGSRRFVHEGPIDRTRIVAMVNIDMIGRPLMDQAKLRPLKKLLNVKSEEAIGVVGTKGRPKFEKIVKQTSRRAGVTAYGTQRLISPIIEQLANNRSDHAAFERVGIPTLFFSSGQSDDYHQPGDTIDKLRPKLISRRARMIYDVIVTLSTAPIEQLPARQNAVVPKGKKVPSAEMKAGDLVVRLQDNSASPKTLSGLQSLIHTKTRDFDAFDPDAIGSSAGLNFEHIISGHRSARNSFTPRRGKYDLYLHDDKTSATLVRMREDSSWDMSSTLTYSVKEPHYIDFEFRCSPHAADRFKQRKYAICFFANYMNDVQDPALHFLGVDKKGDEERWISATAPPGHADWNGGGTYRHVNAKGLEYDDNVKFRLNTWSYDSPRFTKPFYYGRAANGMVFQLMFDRDYNREDEIRFSLFKFKLPQKMRPAWDFQYVIHRVVENKQYGFRGRLVWKPWISRDDCLAEYEKWRKSL